MAYIKIGAQLCMSCAPIALKMYIYFTSSNLINVEYQQLVIGWYK